MNNTKNPAQLQDALNNYLGDAAIQQEQPNQEMDCSSGVCVIKGDKSLVEKINKKILTDDGRQLLI
jgi:hypothetical protein